MAWKALDRRTPQYDPDAPALLREAVKEKIRSFLPRYEQKRAALLPALHVVQDELGHVPYQAMIEVAEVLDIHPSDVLDTISFYTHFWTHKKGKKVVMVCRSISCQVLGGRNLLDEVKKQLGIGEHETTPDGKYSLVTEECLAACDHGPCMLINEKLHKCVKPEDVGRILADAENDKIEFPRIDLFDAPKNGVAAKAPPAEVPAADAAAATEAIPTEAPADDAGDVIGSTSDVDEMKDAD